MATDRAAELRAAADAIAPRWPWIAERLRQAAAAPPDRLAVQRRVLRQIWHRDYRDVDRCVAARLIESAWRRWAENPAADPPLGSLDSAFGRLDRAGCRPLRWRRIADLLDDELG